MRLVLTFGMPMHPPFARAWLAQRRAAAVRLAAVASEELHALSDAEALRRSVALLSMVSPESVSEERRVTSGFVEQQRRFHQRKR